MARSVFLLPFLLLTALLGPACATTAQPAATLAAADRAFLWEVRSGQGQGGTVYVVGSIHVGRAGEFALSDSMEEAFARSDALVVEVDTTKVDAAQVQKFVLAYGLLPPDQQLSSLLEPETAKLLAKAAARVGLPMRGLEHMRPWVVWMMLSALEGREAGYQQSHGVDSAFLDRARGRKEILELESMEEQLLMFAQLPEPVLELMMREQLQRSAQSAEQLERMAAAWREGDGEALAAVLLERAEDPRYRPLYEKMFFERNVRMARGVEALLEQPRIHFVVVGAGHVVGAQGILALLQQKGYAVRQLGKTL
jgi:uncharacterized protein YbaP (TraB family)